MIAQAVAGEPTAIAAICERYRPFVRVFCGMRHPAVLLKREDGSDVVQKTMMDAVEGIGGFRGQSPEEMEAWMLRLLERNMLQLVRKHTAAKRDIRRERDPVASNASEGLVWHSLAASDISPSQSVLRGEAAVLLAEAIERLPEAQQAAVVMRYLSQCSLKEIADQLQTTPAAAAGLVRRGVETLRKYLPPEFAPLS